MPEISCFLGMVIQMYFNEHNPPHFHVQYNEYQAAILIENLGVMERELPAKALSLVVEWGQEHQEELPANWNSLRKSGQFHKIQPLA